MPYSDFEAGEELSFYLTPLLPLFLYIIMLMYKKNTSWYAMRITKKQKQNKSGCNVNLVCIYVSKLFTVQKKWMIFEIM